MAPECYYCLACFAEKEDAPTDVPLLCKRCFSKHAIKGYDDPVQDVALLHFLYHNCHLPGISEASKLGESELPYRLPQYAAYIVCLAHEAVKWRMEVGPANPMTSDPHR